MSRRAHWENQNYREPLVGETTSLRVPIEGEARAMLLPLSGSLPGAICASECVAWRTAAVC